MYFILYSNIVYVYILLPTYNSNFKMEDDRPDPPMETDSSPPPKEDCSNDEGEKEEEKTLTDHLNKKLLESFLQRVDQGEFDQFVSGREAKGDSNDEEWSDGATKT